MRYAIEHEIPGRMRVRLDGCIPDRDIEPLTRVVAKCDAVREATLYPRIGGLAVEYAGECGREGARLSFVD